MIQIMKDGKVVARSKNLRGIYDYRRKQRARIEFYQIEGTKLHVRFIDKATVDTEFADASVLLDWVSKCRLFRSAEFKIIGAPPGPTLSIGVNTDFYPMDVIRIDGRKV